MEDVPDIKYDVHRDFEFTNVIFLKNAYRLKYNSFIYLQKN